ncbi:MAG: hypothetical protein QGH45_06705, partial [Myxococcota bacterium]|nr:hypothetical protein [Myxococcota bacterium]
LSHMDVGLTQLADDLLRTVFLAWHDALLLLVRRPSCALDRLSGGRTGQRQAIELRCGVHQRAAELHLRKAHGGDFADKKKLLPKAKFVLNRPPPPESPS